jgi:GTPase SAR1 family protein
MSAKQSTAIEIIEIKDGYDPVKGFLSHFNAEMPLCNIMLLGQSGVGKSLLANVVLGWDSIPSGQGAPVSTKIQGYIRPPVPVVIWDSPGLQRSAISIQEQIQNLVDFIRNCNQSRDSRRAIHAVWFCVREGDKRIEDACVALFQAVRELGVLLIPVVTQSVIQNESSKQRNREFVATRLGTTLESVVFVLAREKKIGDAGTLVNPHRLDGLVHRTIHMITGIDARAASAFGLGQAIDRDLRDRLIQENPSWSKWILPVSGSILPVSLLIIAGVVRYAKSKP